jgi:hypothetical protein
MYALTGSFVSRLKKLLFSICFCSSRWRTRLFLQSILPELFDRMAYVNKPAQLTTNVYFQHTYQSLTLPRRRASRFLRGYLQMCTYRYTHISHLPDLQSRPRIHASTQPTYTGIRQRRCVEGGSCRAATQIIAWRARARNTDG